MPAHVKLPKHVHFDCKQIYMFMAPEDMSEASDDVEGGGVTSELVTEQPRPILDKRRLIRFKWIQSVCTYAAFIGLGLTVGILGPSLLDLELITNTNVENISRLFTARGLGYLVGSLVGGPVYDKCTPLLLLGMCILVMALTLAALPWCINFYLMGGVLFVQAMACGGLDTAGSAFMIALWGESAEPYFQAVHFTWTLGAFLVPFIVQPFLATRVTSPTTTSPPHAQLGTTRHVTQYQTRWPYLVQTKSPPHPATVTNVFIAYLIIAVYMLIVSIPFFIMSCQECINSRRKKGDSKPNSNNIKKDYEDTFFRPLSKSYKIQILVLTSLALLLYMGIEDMVGGMLMAYVVEVFNWSKADGTYLLSIFWGCFGVGRGVSVPISKYLSPTKMLLINWSVTSISLLVIAVCVGYHKAVLWVFVGIMGLGASSTFASHITWVGRRLQITGKVAAVFFVAGSCGAMGFPAIFGYLVGNGMADIGTYIASGIAILATLVFVLLVILDWRQERLFKEVDSYSEEKSGSSSKPSRDTVDSTSYKGGEFAHNGGRYRTSEI